MIARKIGVILPSKSIYLEPFLYRAAPPLFSFHFTRLLLRDTSTEALLEMNSKIEEAVTLMTEVSPEAILFACASGSFIAGYGSDEEMKSRIEGIADVPAVVASSAMVAALREMGIRRVSLGTPYRDDITEREVRFLEENGFDVVAVRGLGLSGVPIREQSAEVAADLIRQVDRPEAQGIFISCANLRTHEIAEDMERLLLKPVLCTNQVLLWHLLATVGFQGPIRGYGRILENITPIGKTHSFKVS